MSKDWGVGGLQTGVGGSHIVHANSFVGFGGSDGKTRTATYQRQQDDDNHMTRDSGSCVDVGKDVRSCGEFGGEGIGGMALEGEVLSGVVRGSAVVGGLVEGLSTTTTHENDDDNDIDNDFNDTARRATFNAPVMRGPFRPSPECGD